MSRVEGKNGIAATVVADSCNVQGNRMLTLELEYPRIIHGEVMTHGMLVKNSQSSRAVPLTKALDYVQSNGFYPVWWGKNQAGMAAKEELTATELDRVKHLWESCKQSVMHYVSEMGAANLHKQIAARPLEAFAMHKTVISGTEWANLLWLRDHEDAQPEFAELAQCIRKAINFSTPFLLHPGEWHLPYVDSKTKEIDGEEVLVYLDNTGNEIDLDTARKISASCCAQVSYRKLDDSVEKALDIYNKLFSGSRIHASPVAHQATPMLLDQHYSYDEWEEGVTHVDREGNYWSANLKGFIQYRKLISNEAKWD